MKGSKSKIKNDEGDTSLLTAFQAVKFSNIISSLVCSITHASYQAFSYYASFPSLQTARVWWTYAWKNKKKIFSLLVHTPPSFPLLVLLYWCILVIWWHLLVLTKDTEIMRGFRALLATSASHSCLLTSPTRPRACPHGFQTPDSVWLPSHEVMYHSTYCLGSLSSKVLSAVPANGNFLVCNSFILL